LGDCGVLCPAITMCTTVVTTASTDTKRVQFQSTVPFVEASVPVKPPSPRGTSPKPHINVLVYETGSISPKESAVSAATPVTSKPPQVLSRWNIGPVAASVYSQSTVTQSITTDAIAPQPKSLRYMMGQNSINVASWKPANVYASTAVASSTVSGSAMKRAQNTVPQSAPPTPRTRSDTIQTVVAVPLSPKFTAGEAAARESSWRGDMRLDVKDYKLAGDVVRLSPKGKGAPSVTPAVSGPAPRTRSEQTSLLRNARSNSPKSPRVHDCVLGIRCQSPQCPVRLRSQSPRDRQRDGAPAQTVARGASDIHPRRRRSSATVRAVIGIP
jgi:hypothetical protein